MSGPEIDDLGRIVCRDPFTDEIEGYMVPLGSMTRDEMGDVLDMWFEQPQDGDE